MPADPPANTLRELVPAVLGPLLLVLGLSYLVNARRWLAWLRAALADPGRLFGPGALLLAAGLGIALGYGRWDGTWPAFVTLLGWLAAAEGAWLLLLPSSLLRLQRLPDRWLLAYYRCGGLIVALLGGLLCRRFLL